MSSEFDFNAMLMFGWIADKDRNVIKVNAALESWMKVNNLGDLLDQTISIKRFLESILCRNCDGVAERIGEALDELCESVSNGSSETKAIRDDFSQLTITLTKTSESLLAGIRFVRSGGCRMRSAIESDRVDIIVVCKTEKVGDKWQVIGFQGQLQEAWSRVMLGITEGTRAGSVGLMGRSMSHNLGSHPLYYLEQDESDKGKRLFLRYLRDRMELLASFSTGTHLSFVTCPLSQLLEVFKSNNLMLERLCRSEGIKTIKLNCSQSSLPIAIPGGHLGGQALFSIFENIIRDGAKHHLRSEESPATEITLNVNVESESDYGGRFFKVTLHDSLSKFENSGSALQGELDQIQIATDMGTLEKGNWGIKERWIAAAFLRGIQPQDIFTLSGTSIPNLSINLNLPDSEPKILNLLNFEGFLAWQFYLLKPREVLVVRQCNDTDIAREHTAGTTIGIDDWTDDFIRNPVEIRHRFIVYSAANQVDVTSLSGDRARLPERVFILHNNLEIPRHFVSLKNDEKHEGFTPSLLMRERVHKILNGKLPVIFNVTGDTDIQLSKNGQQVVVHQVTRQSLKGKAASYPDHPLVIIDRHGECEDFASHSSVLLYEWHEDGDPMRLVATSLQDLSADQLEMRALELAEAAAIRVLVVDERLDQSVDGHLPNFSKTIRELFCFKRVQICGRKFTTVVANTNDCLEYFPTDDYDFIVVHQSILQKIEKAYCKSREQLIDQLVDRFRSVVVHSGRVDSSSLPFNVKYMPLSHLSSWFDANTSKLTIVEDLCQLRRI